MGRERKRYRKEAWGGGKDRNGKRRRGEADEEEKRRILLRIIRRAGKVERRIRRRCSKEKGTDKEWAREKVQMWRVRMKEGDKEESIRLGERSAGEEKKGGGTGS